MGLPISFAHCELLAWMAGYGAVEEEADAAENTLTAFDAAAAVRDQLRHLVARGFNARVSSRCVAVASVTA